MRKVAQDVIKSIVESDDNWIRLRPLQMAYWGTMFPIYECEFSKDWRGEFVSKMLGTLYNLVSHITIPHHKASRIRIDYREYHNKPLRDLEHDVHRARDVIKHYNLWVDEQNKIFESEMMASIDDEEGQVDYDKITAQEYQKVYDPALWLIEVQTEAPQFSQGVKAPEGLRDNVDEFSDMIGLYSFESKPLYNAMRSFGEQRKDEFLQMLNLLVFDHIVEMKKMAEENGAWDEDSLYWIPFKEFYRYFEKNNIDIAKAQRFEEHPFLTDVDWDEEVDEYTEVTMRKLFGGNQEFDDEYALLDLSMKAREIKKNHNYHFKSYRDAYREACNWWTLKGKQIKWRQLEKAVHKI